MERIRRSGASMMRWVAGAGARYGAGPFWGGEGSPGSSPRASADLDLDHLSRQIRHRSILTEEFTQIRLSGVKRQITNIHFHSYFLDFVFYADQFGLRDSTWRTSLSNRSINTQKKPLKRAGDRLPSIQYHTSPAAQGMNPQGNADSVRRPRRSSSLSPSITGASSSSAASMRPRFFACSERIFSSTVPPLISL